MAAPLPADARGRLLIALHRACDVPSPRPRVAAAVGARGMIRAFRDLREIKGFGRRCQTRLRKTFSHPDLARHLAAALQAMTHNAPQARPPDKPFHPFGEDVWFPPVVSHALKQAERRVYGRPRSLDGFAFSEHIIHFLQASRLPAPRQGVIIGGGYVGVEVAVAWGRAGAQVTLLDNRPKLLDGFDPDGVEVVKTMLDDAGVDVRLNTTAKRWLRHGAQIAIVTDKGDALPADRVLVAVGIIYPQQRPGRTIR
ncbi:MAG: FAD-dependent oxidoreductase [Myxococcota bacterium]